MKVTRIADALGAEVSGLDLAKRLSAETVAELRRHWLEHLVLVFHDQDLPPARFLALAKRFGAPMDYPFLKGLDDLPQVTVVAKLEHETVNFGGIWHSDTTYLPKPPSATMLVAREVPPAGGDTLFANQYLAYDALAPEFKRELEGVSAVSTSAKADTTRSREDRVRDSGNDGAADEYTATHPVVRTHPETGRKSLYVNRAHTARFEGQTDKQSEPMLAYLFEHQTQPQFIGRVAWRVGTVALWDNRCTLHNPANDYQGHRRVMHRITLKGDVPV